MIVGITGTDGAGKGTVVNYLVTKKGFTHYSARNLFEEELVKRGVESNRANMRLVANELRAKHGNDFVVTYYLDMMKNEQKENVVIESIRAIAEANTLKENGGLLLAVDADQGLRYKRIKGRGSSSDKVSYEEFVTHEKLEMNDPDPNGMQKAKVIEMADYIFMNDKSFVEMGNNIDKFLAKFSNQ